MPHLAHQKHHRKQSNKDHLVINQLVLMVAITEPLMTLPQAYQVWIHHQAAGVSIATWSFFTLAAVIWLVYGLVIRNVPLIISSTLWIVLEGSIVFGLIVN